ncbi:rhomboid-like protein [Streptomyces sp. NPDC090127]|uniref:rhomboid-like protein n=1 Tax=Streptomyces sp. NPDC090127 TaxID=3365953 RepID=UPI00380049E6
MRSSPGTHVWLLVIAFTSVVIALSSDGLDHYLLHRNSSNLYQLSHHPVRALLGSAFWIEDPADFALYAVLFELFHAQVERWLGTLRWLVTVATAHIAATLISQKVVLEAIQDHDVSRSMAHVVDIGVSYGLAASVGILTYRIRWPWRWLYLAGTVAFFAVPLCTNHTYTDLGHAISLAIGLAFWPLTRGVGPPGKSVAGQPPPRAHWLRGRRPPRGRGGAR